MNTGEEMQLSENNLLTTIGYGINGKVYYALEGSIFIAGSAIQWLRDGLHMIDSSPESEAYAWKSQNQDEIYVVPAFTGLGAPYWNQEARGSVFGLTWGTTKEDFIKATLQSIAYQVRGYYRHHAGRCQDSYSCPKSRRRSSEKWLLNAVSGRYSWNHDCSRENLETTALGAAFLAGLTVGYWRT